ncbi:transcriptional regulator GcvA [Xanthobacter sp. V4C-4]|uniref:transcriptional regulator GcvA n=1 Tax=Xanthobacter cornucopiae TaxID=3119924 RepID=UPI0037269041
MTSADRTARMSLAPMSLGRMPPMTALRAFVAAAQQRSFAKAAALLHVTPAAIGQQVRLLEAHVGQPLFRRDRRPELELTEVAARLLPGLVEGFAAILAAVERLDEAVDDTPLRVSVAPSFALKWLLPRLDRLRARHPEFDVRIATTVMLADFAADEADCAIRFGAGAYPGLHAQILLSDYVIPVCSPRLAAGPCPLACAADLAGHTLIHDDGAAIDASAPDWHGWLKGEGVEGIDAARGPRFDQALMAIEAAIAGQGVALARSTLVSDDLAHGRLAHPFGAPRKVLHSYYFVCPPHRLPSPKVQGFLAWLKEEAAGEARLQPTPAARRPAVAVA